MVLCFGLICALAGDRSICQDRTHQILQSVAWRNALKGTEQKYLWPQGGDSVSVDEGSESFDILFGDCRFTYDVNLRFISFRALKPSNYSGPPWGTGTISSQEAATRAVEYRNVFTGASPCMAIPADPILNDPPQYNVQVSPVISGIPCYPLRFAAWVELEHNTGKLDGYIAPQADPPLPPDTLTPLIDPTEAAVTAGCYLTQNVSDPPPVMEIEPTMLVIFCPDYPDEEPQNFLTPQQRADVLGNKGILAYRVAQTRLDEYVPALGEGPWNYSYVDARTGQLLMVYSATKYLAGGGPPPGMLSLGRFQWDIGPQKIEVVVGRRSRAVASAKIERTSRSYKSKGISVQLKLGKLLVPASFDRTSGLLKHGSSYGIPDKRLKDVLLELTSKPLHPILVPKYKRNTGPQITPKR